MARRQHPGNEDRHSFGRDEAVAAVMRAHGRKAMKIAIVGSGYVGLVSGACFANWGHEVTCVDNDAGKIHRLQSGEIPIYEPGLADLIQENTTQGRLAFTTDIRSAVKDKDAVCIAVGTPARFGNGEADLCFIYAAAKEIADAVSNQTVVMTKSTVPVGTGDELERIISRRRPGHTIPVVSNPEFLREGSAIADFQAPDRLVIGTADGHAQRVMLELYQPLVAARVPIVMAERRTAELIKYTANAFLAVKISFINEMADLCEQVGADIREVALGIGLDRRIGTSFLRPGPGYGGSCFPKDTLALLRTAQDYGVPLRIVEGTVGVNEARKRRLASKVINSVGGSVDGLTIAILGLTFKPDTDDIRESPSLPLIEALQRAGATIRAHDPQGMRNAGAVLTDVAFFDDPYDCTREADAAVLVTDWESLKSLDFARLRNLMRSPVMIDLRNVCDRQLAERHGFLLTTIGSASGNRLLNQPASAERPHGEAKATPGMQAPIVGDVRNGAAQAASYRARRGNLATVLRT